MCIDPVSLITIGANVAGAGLSAISPILSSQGQAAALKNEARNTLNAGYSEEARYRDDAAQKMATQLAVLSGRGLDISTASPLALQAESAKNAELDALTIRTSAINKSNALKAQASATLRGGWMSFAGNMLGGVSKLGQLGLLGSAGNGSATPKAGGLQPGWSVGKI